MRLYPQIIVCPNGCKTFTLKRLINGSKTVEINTLINATLETDDTGNYIITPIDNQSDVTIDFGMTSVGTLGDASFDFMGEIMAYTK